MIAAAVALVVLAFGSPAAAQSDPFQSVRPGDPTRPAPPADASRTAPPSQPGLRPAPPRNPSASRPPRDGAAPQIEDGTWTGRLRCDPVPEINLASQSVAFTVTMSGSMATYEREVMVIRTEDGTQMKAPAQFERGSGRVGRDGNVSLVGQLTADSGSIQASYRARLVDGALSIEGQQMLTFGTPSRTLARRCAGSLSRS